MSRSQRRWRVPTTPEPSSALRSVVLRAALYALAVAAIVIWGTGETHVFIYQGF